VLSKRSEKGISLKGGGVVSDSDSREGREINDRESGKGNKKVIKIEKKNPPSRRGTGDESENISKGREGISSKQNKEKEKKI